MRTVKTSAIQRPRPRRPAQSIVPAAVVPAGTPGRILLSALRLFARAGFHGTSVRDLAAQCKLQPGALYVHFPSKEHILAELARLGHEAHQDVLRAALLQAGHDPRDQLRAVVHTNATQHATYPQLAMVVNEELFALPAELAAPALALRKQSSALLLDILARGVDAGRFSCANLLVTAAAIGAMSLRIPYWYKQESGLTIATLAEQQAELALRMVGCIPVERKA